MSLTQLQERLGEIYKLGQVSSVLNWDQQTQMPEGGAAARAEQLALLGKLSHQMLTSEEMGKWLEAAEQEVEGQESVEASLVRAARDDYDQAVKWPSDFVVELQKTTAMAHGVWVKARQDNDFSHFQPMLEKIFDLAKQGAEYLGYGDKPYDALLDRFEPGMTSAEVTVLFDDLREQLVPLVHAIGENQDKVSDEVLHRNYPKDKQWEFGEKIAKQMGYDFTRGRQDEAVHPFCTSFSVNDVRITTRFDPKWLNPGFFSTIHETGHAMYEQGFNSAFEGNILASASSLGVHESQSRLWENLVARSRGFWEYFYGDLQATFPDALAEASLDEFYKAINKSTPSLIRVEADEVTYSLHIMIRYDLETAVINDGMAIKDLPAAWNAKYEEYLGITPPNDSLGVLQDVHWSAGIMGYFPTYALGNLLSVQFYDKALSDHPNIPDEIRKGKFDTLLNWMRENIHVHGRRYRPKELVQQVTGEAIQTQSFMRYLTEKYTDLYEL